MDFLWKQQVKLEYCGDFNNPHSYKVVWAVSEKRYFQLLFLLMNSKRLPSWKTDFMNAEVPKRSKSVAEKI